MSNFIDMTGWKMWEHGVPDSRLTVIQRVENPHHKGTYWLCKCSCKEQKEVIVNGNYLRKGRIKSCGCLRSEMTVEFNHTTKKKSNIYELYSDYGIGYCSNTGNMFYFDIADYPTICNYCWNEHIKSNGHHMLETYDSQLKKVINMAELLGCKGYDHKDRNPLNNRRNNLRKATQAENVKNKSRQKNNTSNIIGVGWVKKIHKWRARITVNDKPIYLGVFETKDGAIIARLKAEKQYFGEFAPQQHLYEQYGIINES